MNFHIVISIETQEFFAAGAQVESINKLLMEKYKTPTKDNNTWQ